MSSGFITLRSLIVGYQKSHVSRQRPLQVCNGGRELVAPLQRHAEGGRARRQATRGKARVHLLRHLDRQVLSDAELEGRGGRRQREQPEQHRRPPPPSIEK